MDAFDSDRHDSVSWAEKSTIDELRRTVTKLFRATEISLLLISITWASNRLPLAVRISGEFLRQLLNVLAGHLFVFLLGNAIVITLLLKSRHQHDSQPHEINLCRDLFSASGARLPGDSPPPPAPPPASAETVYEDKETILEVAAAKAHRGSDGSSSEDSASGVENRGGGSGRGAAAEIVEEMSNEEFQRAIEAFIAKQIEFHQQEKVAIVLHV